VTAVPAPTQPRSRSLWSVIRHLGAFGVVGGIGFVIEVGLFQLLYGHLGSGAVMAKAVATIVAMTVAFFGHRHWSFAHRARTGFKREYPMFLVINGLTLLMGLGIVAFARYGLDLTSAWALQGANLVSIAVGTVVRYLLYRQWVFPAADPAP
jgi:putative flippase GtrA